ncbi:hypothetical protein [Leifsonia sp. TF02-11]|nr:hypothetical protein [Leifsonia sp. TF02-11]
MANAGAGTLTAELTIADLMALARLDDHAAVKGRQTPAQTAETP